MKVVSVTILSLLGAMACVLSSYAEPGPAWPSTPKGPGCLDAGCLAATKELSGAEIAASESIVKSWRGESVLVFHESRPSVRFPVRTYGACQLDIGYVSGASYAAFALKLDGVELGRTRPVDDDPAPRVASFPMPHGGTLDLVPLSKQPLAIFFVHPRLPQFAAVPASSWKSLGKGRFESYFFNPVPYFSPLFELDAGVPCEIFVKGKSFLKCDGKAAVIKPADGFEPSLTRLELKLAAASGPEAIKLRTSPLGGGRLLPEIPAFLADHGHVDDWPRATISNGRVDAVVAIPDPERGYYRGQRFEQAGIITSLKFAGHEFVAWNGPTPRSPLGVDHVSGPAEEFWDVVGYDEPDSDNQFLKLGSGVYERSAGGYAFYQVYWPVETFAWKTAIRPDSIEFRQDVSTKQGWGYEYLKRVSLCPGRPALVIEHELRNTGAKRLASAHYNHNFLLVDKLPPGPDYRLEFGFRPAFANRESLARLLVNGHTVSFRNSETLHSRLSGCPDAKSCTFEISHKPTGASILISESEAPFRQALYVCRNGICPESFVRIDLGSGESMKWSRTYLLNVAR